MVLNSVTQRKVRGSQQRPKVWNAVSPRSNVVSLSQSPVPIRLFVLRLHAALLLATRSFARGKVCVLGHDLAEFVGRHDPFPAIRAAATARDGGPCRPRIVDR